MQKKDRKEEERATFGSRKNDGRKEANTGRQVAKERKASTKLHTPGTKDGMTKKNLKSHLYLDPQ